MCRWWYYLALWLCVKIFSSLQSNYMKGGSFFLSALWSIFCYLVLTTSVTFCQAFSSCGLRLKLALYFGCNILISLIYNMRMKINNTIYLKVYRLLLAWNLGSFLPDCSLHLYNNRYLYQAFDIMSDTICFSDNFASTCVCVWERKRETERERDYGLPIKPWSEKCRIMGWMCIFF